MEKIEKLAQVCKLKIQFYNELIESSERHLQLVKKTGQQGIAIKTNESLLNKYIQSKNEWEYFRLLVEDEDYLDERLEFLQSISD